MANTEHSLLLSRSHIQVVDPSLTSVFVQEGYIQNFINTAMLTLVVYSSMTTIDKEIHYFWRKPISVVGCIFFLNRYMGLLGAISAVINQTLNISYTTCVTTRWAEALSDQITILLIDYVLLLRVTALHSQNKRLAVFLRILFAIEAISFMALTIYVYIVVGFVIGEFGGGITQCGENNPPPPVLAPVLWAIPSAYQIILMVFALTGAVTLWKETEGITGAKLLKVLIADQIVYFIIVTLCSAANILGNVTKFDSFFAYVLNVCGTPSLICVVGNHLLIHLREAGDARVNEGTSYRLKTISALNFSVESNIRANASIA